MSVYLLKIKFAKILVKFWYLDLKIEVFDDFPIDMLCISEFSIRYNIDLKFIYKIKMSFCLI